MAALSTRHLGSVDERPELPDPGVGGRVARDLHHSLVAARRARSEALDGRGLDTVTPATGEHGLTRVDEEARPGAWVATGRK